MTPGNNNRKVELDTAAKVLAFAFPKAAARYAQELGTDPEAVPRALAAEHARRVAKRCKEKTTL